MECPDTIRIIVNPRPNVSFTGSQDICVGQTTTLSPTSGGTWASTNNIVAIVSNNGTVTAQSQGTVFFVYTDLLTGCTSIPTSPVTVNLPTNVNVSRDTIDVGKAASLTPNTGETWYSNDTTVIKIINNSLVRGIAVGNISIYFVNAATNCKENHYICEII